MSAGGFANTLRRTLAVALTLLTLAVGALWVDSFRARWTEPLTAEQERMIASFMDEFDGLREVPSPFGLDWSYQRDRHAWFRIRTRKGDLLISSEAGILSKTAVPTDVESSWCGFGYERWTSRQGSLGANNGTPALHADFQVSTVTIPFWALIVALAFYPIVFLIRGPLRRRIRLQRGLCAACGYNLSHSQNRCPECGATVEHAPAPSATDQ